MTGFRVRASSRRVRRRRHGDFSGCAAGIFGCHADSDDPRAPFSSITGKGGRRKAPGLLEFPGRLELSDGVDVPGESGKAARWLGEGR